MITPSILAMPATQRYWTAADLAQFDDEVRREALGGELFVIPPPELCHALVHARLASMMWPYCVHHGLLGPLGPSALTFRDDHLEPDLVVLPRGTPATSRWRDVPLPLLVIEILSPSTRRRDIGVKRSAYLALGIAEYWQLDPESRTLTVSRPGHDDVVAGASYAWRPVPDAAPLQVEVPTLFG
jgi:Uma2 family endonuclease